MNASARLADPAADSQGLAWSPIRLRRDGMRPLRFSGRLIARHDGWLPNAALWHDLALYHTAPAGYAVEIVARLSAADDLAGSHPVCCRAAMAETLEDALALLERHDAAGDVCPGFSAPASGFDSSSPAMATIQAALLQGFCQDIVRRYRIGVGSFLNRVCLAGV